MTRSREVSKGATRVEFVYTATAGQTSFSGNDGNSNSLAYTAGQIDVFLNGVRLAAADYTATNGTAVVLGVGAEAGDTLNINAFGTFSVADVIVDRLEFDYTATAGQTTFTGSDNDSQTMAYTANRIDVYLNGSRLNVTDDYTASNGTSVVLAAGAQAGDSLVVVAHGTVNLASNILSGDLDLNGNELILDVDGDTGITADTDDQIDFKIAGADDFKMTANNFNVLSGSTLTIDSGATITNSGTANGFGLVEVDMFRLTTDTSSGTNADLTTNLERCDTDGFAKIGTGMTESSGIFTFPRTGVYEVKVHAMIETADGDGTAILATHVTLDNSDYNPSADAVGGDDAGTNSVQVTAYSQCFVNVTDTSQVKVKFVTSSFGSSSFIRGNSNKNETSFSFIRLGDSQ